MTIALRIQSLVEIFAAILLVFVQIIYCNNDSKKLDRSYYVFILNIATHVIQLYTHYSIIKL